MHKNLVCQLPFLLRRRRHPGRRQFQLLVSLTDFPEFGIIVKQLRGEIVSVSPLHLLESPLQRLPEVGGLHPRAAAAPPARLRAILQALLFPARKRWVNNSSVFMKIIIG